MTTPTTTIRANWARKPAFEDYMLSLSPVSYWRLNETTGTIAFDRTGGNQGTYTNAPTLSTASLLTGDADYSVAFASASSQYITIPDANSLDVGDTFSFAFVVKRAATGTKHYIVQKGSTSPGIYISAANALTLEKVGTADIVASSTTLDTSAHLCVVTKTGATVALYIDGIDVTGAISNQTCASTASALEWGRSSAAGNYLNGTLDELAVWGTVLTPAQVSQLYIAFAQGELGGTIDSIASYVQHVEIDGGRNADFSGDATGSMSLDCDNRADFFTFNRNLVTNPSFETGLNDTTSAALASVTLAATALNWVADAPTGGGSYCAQASLSASSGSGIYQTVEGTFRSGVTVSFSVALRSVSGTTSVEIGMASSGTPADIAASGGTITTSWATYSYTWTPSSDRTDAVIFVRTRTASAAVVKIDTLQVNVGASANTYVEAPTRPMLAPGTPIHAYSTYSGTDYPLFAGYLERLTPDPEHFTISLLAYDALRTLAVTVDAQIGNGADYSMRQGVIDAAIRKITGAVSNICANGSFETDTTGWGLTGTSARSSTAAQLGTWSLKVPGDSTATYNSSGTTIPIYTYVSGRNYTASFYARLVGAADTLTVNFGTSSLSSYASITTGSGSAASLTSSFQRYTLTWPASGGTNIILSFSCSSGSSAAGVYVDGVQIEEGLVAHTYADFASPSGRQLSRASSYASVEGGAFFSQGWSNRCTNPEAVTNTAGWTGYGDPSITGNTPPVGFSDTDTQSYTTASWTPGTNHLILAWIENSHATAANTVTLSGNGMTWVSIDTQTFNGGANRITLFRALKSSGISAGVTTITVAGTNNTGAIWLFADIAGVDNSGTNGSGAIIQSAKNSGNSQTASATLATLSSLPSATFLGASAAANGAWTPQSGYSSLGSAAGTAPVFTLSGEGPSAFANSVAALTLGIGGGVNRQWGAIGVEVKGGQGGFARVSAGGYGGGYSTAFNLGTTDIAASYAFSQTFRSGRQYSAQLNSDTLASGQFLVTFGSSGTPADSSSAVVASVKTHGVGSVTTITWTPTADRTDVTLMIERNTGSAAYTWSGVAAWNGLHNYARTGVNSPSSLDECATITTIADGISHSNCTSVTTYATAGSGVYLNTTNTYALNGIPYTLQLGLKASAGTPSVAIALSQPYGATPDIGTKTVTLSTSWQKFVVTWTPAATDVTTSDYVMLSIMGTAASAITFYVDDVMVLAGNDTQPFLPLQAAGIDTTQVDVVPSASIVAADAISTLGALNAANLSHHQITPLMTKPWWQYTSVGRQSIVAKTSSETYVSLTGDGVQDFAATELDRQNIYNAISVSYVAGTTSNAVTAYDQTSITRYGLREYTGGSTTYVNTPSATDTTAQTIANLLLTRYKTPRSRPTMQTVNHWPQMFQRRPDDVITVTYARAGIASVLYQILSFKLTIDESETYTREDTLEEFVTV